MSITNAAGLAAAADLRELYREIFERSIDGIAIIDTAGKYIEQNRAHEVLTGFNDADLAGQTPAIHLGQAGFEAVAAGLARDGTYRGVLESRGKSGALKKIDLAAFTVRDATGKPLYFVGIKRDITDHQRLSAERNARLRELECLSGLMRAMNRAHTLQDIYESAIDALITAVGADRASVLVYGADNRMHFQAWRGLSEEYRRAVDGHSPWERNQRDAASICVPDVFADAALQSYALVFKEESIRSVAFIPISFEGVLLGKFMLYYNAPHSYTPDEIRLAEALATQIAVVIHRYQADEALRRSEKLAAAGKLAATVSHEINNPLEAIMNLAFLIRQQVSDDPVARHYLDELDSELRRVSLIARRTLAFYRDTGPRGPLELGPLVEEAVQLFRPKLQASSIDLHYSMSGDTSIFGSAGELRQVLLNLVSNAAEAVGGGGRIDVFVGQSDSSHVVVSVADNGPGFDPANLDLIFEPFFTTKTATGTGLGLSLSREIVQRHGGTISAANRPAGGAIMTVHLPRHAQVSLDKSA